MAYSTSLNALPKYQEEVVDRAILIRHKYASPKLNEELSGLYLLAMGAKRDIKKKYFLSHEEKNMKKVIKKYGELTQEMAAQKYLLFSKLVSDHKYHS